jgi:hypothetical protein
MRAPKVISAPARARRARLAAGLAAAGWLVACGGPQRGADGEGSAVREPPAASGAPATPPAYVASDPRTPVPPRTPRTPIEQRRDAACDQLGPKITACAVEDAKADLAAGKIDRPQFDRDTAPDIQRKHTEEFGKACKGHAYSSRQVRVLEVCLREEARCGPLLDCLGHLSDAPGIGRVPR